MDGSSERVLPETVRQLVLDHVDSLEKLEVLMLVRQEARRTWTPDSVGILLKLPTSVAASMLHELYDSQLVEAHPTDEQVFWYAPRAQQLANAVDDLAVLFERDRVILMKFMAANSIERVRSSAIRAFCDTLAERRTDDKRRKKDV